VLTQKTLVSLALSQRSDCTSCQPMLPAKILGVSLAKGGTHHPSNFMLAHARCNQEKHNKTLAEHWLVGTGS
jgi:HNH endonuclease